MAITCEKCAAAKETKVDAGILRDLPFFNSAPDLLKQFPPSEGDELTHRAAEPLAYYRELPNAIACQFGGHLHNNGYVVRTACGRTYYMGSICGSNLIGLPVLVKAIEKEARRRAEELSKKDVLRQAPSEAAELLARWLPFSERVQVFLFGLRTHCRVLHDELEARSKEGAAGRVVTIIDLEWHRTPREKRVGRPNDQQRQLAGIEVLNPVVAPRSVRTLQNQARAFAETVRKSEPELLDVNSLWGQWTALRKSVDATTRKLERAREMFSEENLSLLVIAAKDRYGRVPADLRVEGTFLYVNGLPVGVDLEGVPDA